MSNVIPACISDSLGIDTEDGDSTLYAVHVLPYRILSDEYGDYSYRKEHSTGELVASTITELATALQALTVSHVLGWSAGAKDAWNRVHLPEPHYLERMKYGLDRCGCHTDFAGKLARAPQNGLTYVEIGTYRIELRRSNSGVPALPTENHGFERVIPALEEALVETRARLTARLSQKREEDKAASLARKRAELEKLRAELGES